MLPVDLAANAASLGADVLNANTLEDFESALREARASTRTTVVQVHTDPLVPAPSSEGWWDVPVAEVSQLDSTRAARATYERHKQDQRTFLSTQEKVETP
jgi:3D-(3,5/4)-trihydroxycyclohexane-1,2-dione acylhydrolase (decyclizing)